MKKNFVYLIIAMTVSVFACKQNKKPETQEEERIALIKIALQKLTKIPKKHDTTIEFVSQNPDDSVITFNTKKEKQLIIRALILQEATAYATRNDSLATLQEKYALVALATNETTYSKVFGESWLKTIEKPYKK
jgi:hypothetical protein